MSNPILNIAVKAARRAGSTILKHLDRLDQVTVERKGRNDFVSSVDRMAEDDIIGIIRYIYPNHRFIAEDGGGAEAHAQTRAKIDDQADAPVGAQANPLQFNPAQPAPGKEWEWIIDPLDGTANFLHGHPQFAVSIAARQNGQLCHAVILDPLRDELYTASRGGGAQMNNRRIRVTQQNDLAHSLLATGFPFREPADFDPWMRSFRALLPRVADIRRGGSAALDLAFVARGRLDGYWEAGLKPWNIAAGSLLVREAGGLVADYQGNQNFLESGRIIAANPMIFNDLIRIIAAKTSATARLAR